MTLSADLFFQQVLQNKQTTFSNQDFENSCYIELLTHKIEARPETEVLVALIGEPTAS